MAWVQGMEGTSNEALANLGRLSTAMYRSREDPLVFWLTVVFDSYEAYRANAERPNQHSQYQRMRACLESDPRWHDGDVFFFGTRRLARTSSRCRRRRATLRSPNRTTRSWPWLRNVPSGVRRRRLRSR